VREVVNIGRQPGEPLTFSVDLKWSLWSYMEEYWEEYAPEAFAHLRAGFAGAFAEHGDTLVIHTAPRTEIRYGTVTLDPRARTVRVEFRSEFDEGEVPPAVYESDEFPLPETLAEFLAQVDEVEDRLIDQVNAL
jgi:hypothetical protein